MAHKIILFLNENPLPKVFNKGTISGKELRLRAAIGEIDEIHAVSLPGQPVQLNQSGKTLLEKKIHIHLTLPWPYYLSSVILFIYGLYYTLKLKPILIEAESPLFSGPAAAIIGRLTGTPVLIEYRASYQNLINLKLEVIPHRVKKLLLNFIQGFTFKSAAAIVVNSVTYQEYLHQIGFSSVVVNPGLQYPPQISQVQNKNRIGYLGRLVPEKGIAIFLDAVKILEPILKKKHIIVEIAGIGPEATTLQRKTTDLELDQVVKFLGIKKNYETISSWLCLANPCIVAHPLEMVNAEAALVGTPVVCFGDNQIPETVIHQTTGLKVKNFSPKALAAAIKKIITNENLQKKLSQNGPTFAQKNYGFETQVQKLKDLYRRLEIIESSGVPYSK